MPYPQPLDEAQRLARLRALLVLDTPPEPVFDTLAELASKICGAPIALLSLIDAERQWFKANVGLPGVNETPRDVAFCAHAIQSDDIFIVPDATADQRFADNPLVTGQPDIRFYAGAPLVMSDGTRLGTLCVIDRLPRQLDPGQRKQLALLARAAVQALEMRHDLVDRSLALRDAREREIAASEARLRAILDAQSEMVSQAHPDGTLVYVNPSYAAKLGLGTESVVGSNLFDYVDPADIDLVRERIEWVCSTGQTMTTENRMVLVDGSDCWISWTNTRQTDADGRALLHSTGRDISARVRAERALRQSQALLARTGRVAGVGGWMFDLGSRAVTWSDQTRRIHEVPPDFVPTLDNAIAFYAPEGRERIAEAVRQAMEHGTGWDLELPLDTARGRRIWVRAVGELELDDDGKPARLIGAFQDITERYALQQRVADSENFLREMADALPVRIAYTDRERRYQFVNLRHCERFGLPREAILGRTREQITGEKISAELDARLTAVLAGAPQTIEFSDGEGADARAFEGLLVPHRDRSGNVVGFFSTSYDITERQRAASALSEIAAMFENTSDWIIQTDLRGAVRYVNPAARRAFGMQEGAGTDAGQQLPASVQAVLAEEAAPAADRDGVWLGQVVLSTNVLTDAVASIMVISHHNKAGTVDRRSLMLRDISAAVAAENEARRQTQTLQSVADTIPATVAVVNKVGRYQFVNRAFAVACGRPAAEVHGKGAREILGEEEFDRRRPYIDRVLRGEAVSFELRREGPRGLHVTAIDYFPLRSAAGEPDGFVVVTQDITAQRQEQERLQLLSQTDPLTGLLNRAGFGTRLDGTIDDQHQAPLAVLYVDLDRFKPVNDTHGHAAGDELLKLVAKRLVRLVRPRDAVARLGGDEFGILLPGVSHRSQAERVAESVVKALDVPFTLGAGIEVKIGASVGAALGMADGAPWTELLQRADRMLYQAKTAGRGRYAIDSGAAPH